MSTIHSSSETTTNSPTPISPFSTYSVASEETSDESPDLGAFTTVFRALNHLQPFVPRVNPHILTEPDTPNSTDTGPLSSLPTDSEFIEGSTVWNQSLLASYLASSSSAFSRSTVTIMTASPHLQHHDQSIDESGEETEGEHEPHTFTTPSRSHSHHSDADLSHSHSLSDGDVDLGDQPSLGDLGGAFSFLAAERARLAARDRGTGKDSSTSDGAWRNEIESHRARKRRRKRPKAIHIMQRDQESLEQESTSHTTGTSTILGEAGKTVVIAISSNPEPERGTEELSSFVGNVPAATPSTLQRGHKASLDRLRHSHSTPSLHLSQIPANPQILKLRCLAHKLRLKFPEDYDRITALLTQDFSGGDSDFSDPRGPAPRPRDSLIHVFVDHSNILIGFLNYARRHTTHSSRKRRLSHAALALLLERGRPITRRCLVTSSPLYQSMDTAEQLGYEVRILERVPDSGDGQDRRPTTKNNGDAGRKGHAGGSSDSDKGVGGSGGAGAGAMASGSGAPRNGRVRYREQCVDELLQLKLHQAIADTDVPLPGATIVLATGDGNVGQFNDEGFLGPVRTALKKGWRVELYAWEEGLSRAWRREFGEGTPWKDKFRIIKMEDFGEDLLEVEEGR